MGGRVSVARTEIHDVFDDDLGQALLVVPVGEQRKVDFARAVIQVLQHSWRDVAKDHTLLDICGIQRDLLELDEVDALLLLGGRRKLKARELLCPLSHKQPRNLWHLPEILNGL